MHEADGLEPPETAYQPDQFPETPFLLDAFWRLSPERPLGAMGGVGYIPRAAIKEYARDCGIEGLDDVERFIWLIRQMDGAYIEYSNEKSKAAPEKPNATK